MKRLAVMLVVCNILGEGLPADAHHGRDFLFSQTAILPHAGELYLLPRFDYIDEGDLDKIEFEPTFLVGAADWLVAEVHAHVAKEGEEPFAYESTAGALHVRVSQREAKLALGIFAEYEYSHVDEHPDRIEFRLAASRTFPKSLVAFNVVAEEHRQDEARAEWGYSLGYRRGMSGRAAWGVEAEGGLEESIHEVLAGLYFDPTSRIALNVGAGTGASDSEIDFSLRTALVCRLGRVN